MPKKRSAPISNANEPTTKDGLDQFLQQPDEAKRVKLTSLSNTKLEDLPLEIIERIFIKAIEMEVEEMHLVKYVWKKKANLVICRLKAVCPCWSKFLKTKFFQDELYRTLDNTVEKTSRLEILHQFPLYGLDRFPEACMFKDELFILCQPEDESETIVNVYDRHNLSVVKDIIDLSYLKPYGIAACNVSNCLYILNDQRGTRVVVLRITKEAEQEFSISPVISCIGKPSLLCLSGNGSIILSHICEKSSRIALYDASGSLQHKLKLTSDLRSFLDIIPRSNGNLVLVGTKDEKYTYNYKTRLTEIDLNGTILRQYQSSLSAQGAVCSAGSNGRILIVERLNRIEILDSEFNCLNTICPQLNLDHLPNDFYHFGSFHCNDESNELVTISQVVDGSVQHEISLSMDIRDCCEVIPKSNGNLVLVSVNKFECRYRTKVGLMEIDMNGTVVRQYRSSLFANNLVCNADLRGRILIVESFAKFELLDQEFNRLSVSGSLLDNDEYDFYSSLRYNGEKNEVHGSCFGGR